MLEALFNSELRVKLLNLFLLHPESKYCVSQISSDLKISSATVRKEIENILKIGLINESKELNIEKTKVEEKNLNKPGVNNSKSSGKKITAKNSKEKKEDLVSQFSINKSFILYPKIKSLFIKAQILSSQNFILSLEKNFAPKLLVLTGFFTNQIDAETDLLIVGQIKRPIFIKLISDLEKELGHEINFTIMDETEFNYRKEIMDLFLHTILDGKKIVLIDNVSTQ